MDIEVYGDNPAPPWGGTDNKVRWLLEQVFDPKVIGKEVRITVGDVGINPKPGLRYIKIYEKPRFGTVKRDNAAIDEFIRTWRAEVEPYLAHINAVHYRTATRRGASKLYLYYDPELEGGNDE